MRLIRLTTEDPNAIFDNQFKNDIVITPKSKIALKSLSLEVDTSQLESDSSNDKISFQVSTNEGQKDAQLNHLTYDGTTAPQLFNNMDVKMNAQLTTDSGSANDNIGIQIRNSINKQTRFQSQFLKARLGEHLDSVVLDKGPRTVNTSGSTGFKVFKASGGATPISGNECYFYDSRDICKGGGVLRIKTSLITGLSGDRFIVGLTTTNPDTLSNNTPFNLSDVKYGIQAGHSGDKYYPILNGVVGSASSFTPATNDITEMGISGGQVVGRIWKTANSNYDDILTPQNYSFEDLYPIIILLGRDTEIQLQNLRYTPNPYHSNTTYSGYDLDNEGRLGATPPNQGNYGKETQHFLQFEGSSLSSFLGYSNNRIPQSGTQLSTNFTATANKIFRPNNISDAFIVEMLNIGLDSYDGETQDRKSYLSVVPKSDSSGGVVYDAVYPIFIDINNFQPLSLRNIKCRILNNDLSPVNMLGLSTLSLLIENGDERQFDILQ
jgi:hypothetical protein